MLNRSEASPPFGKRPCPNTVSILPSLNRYSESLSLTNHFRVDLIYYSSHGPSTLLLASVLHSIAEGMPALR